jgi:maleylpyruvate isomerase
VKLVLHNYWRSSASHRVRIGLHLKGLPYEYVAVSLLAREQQSAAYRAHSPMAQVPTLEVIEADGSRSFLTQSIAILEYLDERIPTPPLMPRDPEARARVRILAEIVNSGIQPLQNTGTTEAVKAFGGDATAWTREHVARGLAALERATAETAGAFSVGDSPTIADCCLVPQLASARRFGVDVGACTVLLGVEARCLALPAFADAAPDRQPDAVRS